MVLHHVKRWFVLRTHTINQMVSVQTVLNCDSKYDVRRLNALYLTQIILFLLGKFIYSILNYPVRGFARNSTQDTVEM